MVEESMVAAMEGRPAEVDMLEGLTAKEVKEEVMRRCSRIQNCPPFASNPRCRWSSEGPRFVCCSKRHTIDLRTIRN